MAKVTESAEFAAAVAAAVAAARKEERETAAAAAAAAAAARKAEDEKRKAEERLGKVRPLVEDAREALRVIEAEVKTADPGRILRALIRLSGTAQNARNAAIRAGLYQPGTRGRPRIA